LLFSSKYQAKELETISDHIESPEFLKASKILSRDTIHLKGQCHEIFDFRFLPSP
jgi:hypothetical protein